jgi:hypothetical protein
MEATYFSKNLVAVYLPTLFQQLNVASNEGLICEKWNGKDLEGSGRGLIYGTFPAFARDTERKPWKTSLKITSLRADIWTWDLPNKNQESLDYNMR